MLVLSRRPGQKIMIGNEITIEVVSVSGEGVRLGISAPASTSVHRHEVFVEIENANRAAGAAADAEQQSLEGLAAHLRNIQKQ
jgi:carbon storage regulator